MQSMKLLFFLMVFVKTVSPILADYLLIRDTNGFSPCSLTKTTVTCNGSSISSADVSKSLKIDATHTEYALALHIIKYPISDIPANFIDISPNIRAVKIHSIKRINSIDRQAFQNCKTLISLEISGIQDSSQPYLTVDNVFNNLISMKHLKLVNLNITKLTYAILKTLNSLESLTVENAPLSSIDSNSFNDIRNLTEFHITGLRNSTNIIRQLESWNSLGLSPNEISLINCNLNRLPAFSSLIASSLTRLSLAQNPIDHIYPNETSNIKNLEFLSLISTKVTKNSVSGLSNLSKLKQIKLDNIQTLKDLPSEIQNLTNLELISFDISSLEQITIQLPSSITAISVCNLPKSVQISPNFLENSKNLRFLNLCDLDGVNLDFFTRKVNVFKNSLKSLTIYKSLFQINELWPFISSLTGLETLSLRSAGVESIPDSVLKSLVNLKVLHLPGNSLRFETINSEGFQMIASHLLNLDLSDTKLPYLPQCTFYQMVNFSGLNILNNKYLHCDCSLQWLHEYVRSLPSSIPSLNFTCNFGPNYGKSFYQLSKRDLNNCSSTFPSCIPIKSGTYKVSFQPEYNSKDSILILRNISAFRMRFMFNHFSVIVKHINDTFKPDQNSYEMTLSATQIKLPLLTDNFDICILLYNDKLEYFYPYNCVSVPVYQSKRHAELIIGVVVGSVIVILLTILIPVCVIRKLRREKEKNDVYIEESSTEYSQPEDTYQSPEQYTYVSDERCSIEDEDNACNDMYHSPRTLATTAPIRQNSKLISIPSKSLDGGLNVTNIVDAKRTRFKKNKRFEEGAFRARSSSNLFRTNNGTLQRPSESLSLYNLNTPQSANLPHEYRSRALPNPPQNTFTEFNSANGPPPKPKFPSSDIKKLLSNADKHLSYFSNYLSKASLNSESPRSGDSGLGISKLSSQSHARLSDPTSVII